jgi:membrane protease YdiL (CAAX protease family)
MTAPIEQEPIAKPPVSAKRWGFWATLGFSVVIVILFLSMQGFAIGLVIGIQEGIGSEVKVNQEELIESIASNGFYISVGVIVSAWVGTLVIAAIVLLRKGISFKEYLAIKNVPFKVYALWSVFVLLFLFAWQGVSLVWEPTHSEWMTKAYQSAEYLPLLWVALVVAAPLVEELFFRGFLFEGLRDSWMGSTGSVLVTSIAWAAIHMQYEMFQMVMIGTLGILLGVAKVKTRSLYIPIAMHSFNNLIATVATSLSLDS